MSWRTGRATAATAEGEQPSDLDSVPVALVGCDSGGRVTTVNTAARALLGWSSLDVIGRRALDIVGRDVLFNIGQLGGRRTNSRATQASGSMLDVELVVGSSEVHRGTGDYLVAVLPDDATGASHVGASPRVDNWAEAGKAIRAIGGHVQCTIVGVIGVEAVNRGYSRSTGDRILREVLERLVPLAGASGVVLRIAGKQFLIVTPVASPIDVASVAATVTTPIVTQLGEVRIGCYVGSTSGDSVSPYVLLDRVDAATRLAEARGPGSVETVPLGGYVVDARQHRLSSLLVDAVARGEIHVHYQPIIDLRSGQVVAFESRARWTSPELGVVDPSDFIDVAESTGLIHALGRQVLDESLAMIAGHEAGGPERGRRVSVKCSAVQLADPTWFGGVVTALARHDLSGTALQLELTGTRPLADIDAAAARLAELRTLGVHIALDDFGSGSANASYLHDLPIDAIKIGRRFVAGIASNSFDRAVVDSMIALASELGIAVIAKGVEQADQHFALLDGGCALAQGDLYSPACASDVLGDAVEFPTREALPDFAAPQAADANPGCASDSDTGGPVDGEGLFMSASG